MENMEDANASTPTSASDSGSNVNIDSPMPPIYEVDEVANDSQQTPGGGGGGRPPIRRNSNKSIAWNHFTKVPNCDPNDPKAKCNYCGHISNVHPKRNGTSSMLAHLKGCVRHKTAKSRMDDSQQKLSFDVHSGEADSSNLTIAKYSAEKIKYAIGEMIIVDEFPFRIVEGQGFRKLIRTIEPRFSMPSRTTVMRDCVKIYLKEKTILRSMFMTNKQRISFTTDTWTSIQNYNYMCVTSHFIDNQWKLHKRIIAFCRVEDHKGVTIGRHLEECMVDWGIDRVMCITVDNASCNDTAIDWLKRRPIVFQDVICAHKFMQMRCCAHILNLIVCEGLKEVDDSIVKIRNVIKYVRSSPQRLEQFNTCVIKQKIQSSTHLTLDVTTRWNSTYKMLEVAEKYQSAFELLQLDDANLYHYLMEDGHGRRGLGPPTYDDWETIRHFVKFLKVFYDATIRISGSLYATANLFFHELAFIHKHLQSYCSSDDAILSIMAERMKVKYDKYWGDLNKVNPMLFVAAVLDPRVKFRVLDIWFKKAIVKEKAEEYSAYLRTTIDQLFEQYSKMSGNSGDAEPIGRENLSSPITKSTEDDLMSFLQECHQIFTSVDEMEKKSEVERYLMESPETPTLTFDILNWWKVNSSKYPILALIARDLLAIPITTVASESAFSTGGRVLDPFRSSLAPKTVEALICAQNWLKSTPISLGQSDCVDFVDENESHKLDLEMTSDLNALLGAN